MITSQSCIQYLLWMMYTAFGLLFIKRNVEGWGGVRKIMMLDLQA